MGVFLLSVGAFAQSSDTESMFTEFEKLRYVKVDGTTAYNSLFDCWIGMIFDCDENGNPVRDPEHNTGIVVTAYLQSGIRIK